MRLDGASSASAPCGGFLFLLIRNCFRIRLHLALDLLFYLEILPGFDRQSLQQWHVGLGEWYHKYDKNDDMPSNWEGKVDWRSGIDFHYTWMKNSLNRLLPGAFHVIVGDNF